MIDILRKKGKMNCQYITKVFAFVYLVVFPLVLGINGYATLTQTKKDFFRLGVWVYVALCLYSGLKDYVKNGKNKIDNNIIYQKITMPRIFVLLYLVWCVVASLKSEYPADVWQGMLRSEGLYAVLLYIIIFVLISFYGEFSPHYFYGMGCMAVIFSLIGIMQIAGFDFLTPENYNFWDSLFISTIGNTNMVSGLASITIPVLITAFIIFDNKKSHICLLGALLLLYILLFAGVDSGKVSLIAVFIVLLPFLFGKKDYFVKTLYSSGWCVVVVALYKIITVSRDGVSLSATKFSILLISAGMMIISASVFIKSFIPSLKINEKRTRLITACIVLLTCIAGLIFIYNYNGNINILNDACDFLHGTIKDSAGDDRGIVWKTSLKFIKESPVFGYGPGTYLHLSEPYANSGIFPKQYDFAHNDLIQIACNTGIPGLVLYLCFIGTLMYKLFKNVSKNPVLLIFIAGIIGYFVYLFFGFSIEIISPLFWIMCGIGDSISRKYN